MLSLGFEVLQLPISQFYFHVRRYQVGLIFNDTKVVYMPLDFSTFILNTLTEAWLPVGDAYAKLCSVYAIATCIKCI